MKNEENILEHLIDIVRAMSPEEKRQYMAFGEGMIAARKPEAEKTA